MNELFRTLRRRDRFSMRGLAHIAPGLTFQRIHEIEHGARPSPIEAAILAAALRCPVKELFGEVRKKAEQQTTTATESATSASG